MKLAFVLVLGIAFRVWALEVDKDVKLVRAENHESDMAVFLTETEIIKFVEILKNLRPISSLRGKSPPEPLWFYYWTYDAKSNNLVRNALSFSTKGQSVNWKSDVNTSELIIQLVMDVTSRYKEDVRRLMNLDKAGDKGK